MGLNIPIIVGSVRSDRIGIRPARFLMKLAAERGHEPRLIDPLTEFPLPLLDRMYKEYDPGEAPPVLQTLAEIFQSADAIIVVSGEYNHSVPPALSNLLDHFLEEYFFRPSAIACYSAGSFGGVRAAMQLRSMLGELGMPSIPSILPFPKAGELLTPDGDPQNDRLPKSAARFFSELEWYAEALKAARKNGVPY